MPVVKLQAIPVALSCADSARSQETGAKAARAWAFKSASHFSVLLYVSTQFSGSVSLSAHRPD